MLRESLKNKCDLLTDNYKKVHESFKWEYASSIRLAALLYTFESKTADTYAIRNCKNLIKDNAGTFSMFKDITKFMTSAMLSLHQNPEQLLTNALKIYKDMKKEGFHASSHLVLAAITIAMQVEPTDYDRIILTAKLIFDAMKERHRFITSYDDYGFAVMLAMSGKTIEQIVSDMEYCYSILKETFSNSNAVQALSQIVTLHDEEAGTKCSRVVELHEALRNRKCKFSYGMELSFLGVCTFLNENPDRLAEEISETKDYLKSRKGFGNWSISANERLMYAIALVCEDYLQDIKKNAMQLSLVNNVTGIVIAQQMAIMVAATSGSAAAAASAAH